MKRSIISNAFPFRILSLFSGISSCSFIHSLSSLLTTQTENISWSGFLKFSYQFFRFLEMDDVLNCPSTDFLEHPPLPPSPPPLPLWASEKILKKDYCIWSYPIKHFFSLSIFCLSWKKKWFNNEKLQFLWQNLKILKEI